MKKITLCMSMLFFMASPKLYAQTAEAKKQPTVKNTDPVDIRLDKLGASLGYKKLPYTDDEFIADSTRIKARLTSAKGACTFYTYNKTTKQVLIKGAYKDAPNYEFVDCDVLDSEGNKIKVIKLKQCHPIETGIWTYYSPDGKLLKTEKYVNGKVVK